MTHKLMRSASDGRYDNIDNAIFNFKKTSPAPLKRSSTAPPIFPGEHINFGIEQYFGIEQFVSRVVNRNNFEISDENVKYIKGDNFYQQTMPVITLNGKDKPLNKFRIFDTPPDGTCLIHSVLFGLSPTYPKLNEKDKRYIASLYRKLISGLDLFEEERNDLLNPDIYLNRLIAIKLAKYLHFNLVIFPDNGFPDNSPIIDGQPYVFIYQSGVHFSGIEIPEIDGKTPEIDANELNEMIQNVIMSDHILMTEIIAEKHEIETQPLTKSQRDNLITFLKDNPALRGYNWDVCSDDILILLFESSTGSSYFGGKKKSRKQRNKNKKRKKKSRKTKQIINNNQ